MRTEFPMPCEASVDRTRMRQVFANLLDNAVKYTPAGGTVTVDATYERLSDPVIVTQIEKAGARLARLYLGTADAKAAAPAASIPDPS